MQSIVLTALLALGATLPALTAAVFNQSEIALATREGWCRAQVSQCPALCADKKKGTTQNECYPENLFYSCVCDDGLRPNLTEYSETIPYYICTIEQGKCITACGLGNNDCAEQCRKTNVCGATSPPKVNATSSSAASSTSSGPAATDGSGSGFASAGGSGGNNNSGAAGLLLHLGSACGLGLVAAGIAIGAAFTGL